MKVVYWPRVSVAREEVIAELRGSRCKLVVAETLEACVAAIPGADALVLLNAPEHEALPVCEALKRPGSTVRWLHFLTAGREGFEAAGLPEGVSITYAAGAMAPTVAEHAMALLLACGRRLPEALSQMNQQTWNRGFANRAISLEGAVVGIVGMGQIGQQVAPRASAFGCRVVSFSRAALAHPGVHEALPLVDLQRHLPRLDAIVLALALAPETKHLFGREAFAVCKPGVVLVNVSRGGLVEQSALAEALQSGRVGAAGLDVTDPEPLPPGDPLWGAPNLLVTPHYAGLGSAATLRRLALGVSDNLRRLQAGEPLLHCV